MIPTHFPKRTIAFTLVELLVAIAIISTLTILALPTVKESLSSNAVARSADIVRGAMLNARALARQHGQPYGIVLERGKRDVGSGNLTALKANGIVQANLCTRIAYAQVPGQVYTGEAGALIYPFVTLAAGGNNCSKRFRYFVRQSDAGLLFAAADNPVSPAARLIGPGSVLTVAGRSSVITSIASVTNLNLAITPFSGGSANCLPVITRLDLLSHPGDSQLTVPGVVISTEDEIFASPSIEGNLPHGGSADNLNVVADGQSFEITLLPTRAPLTPVNLPGRSAIDLSVSGPRESPLAFGVEQIVNPTGIASATMRDVSGTDLINELGDVVIMFAADGRVDSYYVDVPVDVGGGEALFELRRFPAPSSISMLVGHSTAIVENIDDLAAYPDGVPGTSFTSPSLLDPVPSSADPEFTWVTVQSISGAVRTAPVVAQPTGTWIRNYFGFDNSTLAREIVAARVLRSRRLVYGGAL